MLSILIPIYNQEIISLVEELISQCIKAKTSFEIICLDDGSADKFKRANRPINGLMGVNYVELSENIGRSKIRRRLVQLARYEYLLFIDSDSKILSKKFIKRYILEITKNKAQIICGGRNYRKYPPKSKQKLLHWKYGTYRESLPLHQRKKRPIELFHSNNFVVSRDVATKYPFEESLETYGYEDLVWAQSINNDNHKIVHIDNPVLHAKLKSFDDFISDTNDSIINLADLYINKKMINTRLIRVYQKLKIFRIDRPFLKLLDSYKDQIYNKLMESDPKLFYLDLYKLHYFDKSLKTKRK